MENHDTHAKYYWAIEEELKKIGLTGTDKLINRIIDRVQTDADEDWNTDDIRIAIRNELNELIENVN